MKKAIIAALIVIPSFVWAQEPWSLEQCIEHALQNNLRVKQQELNVKSSESELKRSRESLLPTLNLTGNHSYSKYPFADSSNWFRSTSLSLSSSVTLFDGLQNVNTIKQNQYDLKASYANIEKIKNDIALAVASSYLQILYQLELVEVSKKQLSLTQMQVDRTKKLYEAGSIPEGTLLEVEALQASDELQLVNALNQLDIAYLNLTQLLEIKNPEGFGIQKPILPEVDSTTLVLNAREIYFNAETRMPQIIGSQFGVNSAEVGLKKAKGLYLPDLSLNASLGSNASKLYTDNPLLTPDPFFTQIKNNANASVGLSLRIPIFNGGSTKNRVTLAKISLDRARLNLETEKNSLYKDIQQATADAVAAQKRQKAAYKNKVANEESLRYSENKFNVGLITAFDYTTARNKYSKAETDLLQAKYEFLFKLKILDFYKGVPLKL